MKIGVLTGGGDAPGLNAVIRAVVRKCLANGHEMIGIREGWRGILENKYETLDRNSVSGILHRGGTILATSRTNVYKTEDGEAKVIKNMKDNGIDALVAIGGEDTLGVASKLAKAGVKIVGVPKTIDNDLSATDFTFGFDTAVNVATEAIDRLHTTAESHNRVIVVEVMGRHAGWIAAYAGIAGGADIILVPEIPYDINEVCDTLHKRHEGGKSFSIVVASEGAVAKKKEGEVGMILQDQKLDSFGHVRLGGIGNFLAEQIEKITGYETRSTVLGHIQRGGTPTAFDRVLGTRLGFCAAELVEENKWGYMAALKGTSVVGVQLAEATGELKTIDLQLMDVANTFFG
ncbi:MAG: phosphofructokinase [Ignavibacteria bacterium]|nr:MAG: phosphofructokinase [Ignavibacteria bacterium]KAF0161936.1 MAG: phosphofructokinase [Ignavibacteria bacterium]